MSVKGGLLFEFHIDCWDSDVTRAEADGLQFSAANSRRRLLRVCDSEDVELLIREYGRRLGLVGSATADLPHFAYAVAYNMDYLLTWNCKHIANGQVIRRLAVVNAELERPTPIIVTPEELMNAFPGDDE